MVGFYFYYMWLTCMFSCLMNWRVVSSYFFFHIWLILFIQERKEKEALAAEDGWTVVVHHKGRKKTTDSETGIAVGSVSQAAVMDNMDKKKNKDVGLDFYRFQKREAKRNGMLIVFFIFFILPCSIFIYFLSLVTFFIQGEGQDSQCYISLKNLWVNKYTVISYLTLPR